LLLNLQRIATSLIAVILQKLPYLINLFNFLNALFVTFRLVNQNINVLKT